ncbi:MAG: hypothetical protein O7C63_08650 [Alphaproteobacteria bacterium]|nr:hypothetical protein [Alphaproteobacteria bacterium]
MYGLQLKLPIMVRLLFGLAVALVATLPHLAGAQTDDAIDGFRSARFGMDAPAVRQAIAADFGVAAQNVSESRHSVERTKVFTIAVNDLVPDSGPASVVYIFGFQSERLIQVNVIWGSPVDPAPDAQKLVATSTILRNFFLEKSFPPESVIADVALTDEVLVVYQGSDAGGRAILLTLTAPLAADQPDDSTVFDMSRLSLALSYISEPTNPDVFTLPADDF